MRGSSKLVVTGQDLSAVMDLIDFTGLPYPGMSPDLRVLTILAKYAVFGIIPEVMPASRCRTSPCPSSRSRRRKAADLAYIQQLAEGGRATSSTCTRARCRGRARRTGDRRSGSGVPQPSLNVNMDAWTNVESLSFRYEPQSSVTADRVHPGPDHRGAIAHRRFRRSPRSTRRSGCAVPVPQKIEPARSDTAKLVPGPGADAGHGRAVETADVVTGDGTLDVLRYGQMLRARSLVGVRGAGLAFDGMHYVESTTHNIKPGEYKQSFVLKRNALISNLPVVPSLARTEVCERHADGGQEHMFGKYRGIGHRQRRSACRSGRLMVQVPDVSNVLPVDLGDALRAVRRASSPGFFVVPDDRLRRVDRVRAGQSGLPDLGRLLLGLGGGGPGARARRAARRRSRSSSRRPARTR